MSQPRYKLTYYNARGLAEPIRLIFAYAGVEYEDFREPMLKFTDVRREDVFTQKVPNPKSCNLKGATATSRELRTKYGYLPILEIDGESYTQTYAICFYLARKYGLMGEDEFENFRIEEFVDQLRDYFNKWRPMLFDSTSQEKKNELKNRMLNFDNPNLMSKFSDILTKNQANGSPWLVGKKISWADICLAQFTSNFEISLYHIELTKNFPKIKELQKLVFEQPGIKEWIAKRPDSDF